MELLKREDLELTKKDMELLMLKQEKELELSKKDMELLKLENDLELLKKDIGLLKLKYETDLQLWKKEIEILKVQSKREIELFKAEHQAKINLLEKQLRKAQCKIDEKMNLRHFFKMFRTKYVARLSGITWNDKWSNFLKTKKHSLDYWGFDEKSFMETYWELFQEINKNIHPIFIQDDCLEIHVKKFTNCQFRLLGFLWEKYDLPINNFKILYDYKPAESVKLLKKRQDSNESL